MTTTGDPSLPGLPEGITAADLTRLYDAASDKIYRYSGAGSATSLYSTILRNIDRFGYNLILPNHEVAGLTFFTRPQLNFTSTSLNQDPILATINTADPQSFPFAIRCLLDSNYARRKDVQQLANISPFFNPENPFITPLTNCLVSISGFPDFTIDTETCNAGFFGEDQTIAIGADMGRGTYDASITFREIQGGFIFTLFYHWLRFMGLQRTGVVTAYPDQIAKRVLNYTVSIYRFILDPSRRFITKWCKATGCFPKSLPVGAIFNISERESYLSSSAQFPIPFTINHFEAMNPHQLKDFNTLVQRYCPGIESYKSTSNDPENNFLGIPYINIKGQQNELMFMAKPEELHFEYDDIYADLKQRIERATYTPSPANSFTA